MVFNTEEVYNNGLIIYKCFCLWPRNYALLMMFTKMLNLKKKLCTSTDEFDIGFFNNIFLNKNIKCDLLL